MAITTLNNLAINRSDTAAADQLWTATSATATDFQTAPSGAWTFIKSQTASASTSIDFVNGTSSVVFDDTYIAYQLKAFSVKGTTDKAIMTVLVSNDTGSSYETSGYKTRMTRNGGTVGNGYVTTAFMYADDTGTATGENMSYTLDFFNPAQTSDYARGIWTTCYSDESTADSYITLGGAIYAVAGAIDAFRIIMSTGNIASGSFYLYGLAKS